MENYQQSPLWCQAFNEASDGFDKQRTMLVSAFTDFRDRVSMLVAQIHKDMPSLTVHDITHIDALWWTASEIAGPDYCLNPAEAFVLGGAFLLHDSAHCIAAYPGGMDEIMALPEWEMYCSVLGYNSSALIKGTDQFQQVLFEVLRSLHPKQARVLARQSWNISNGKETIYLLPQDDLRRAYAEVIGEIAESHWHSHHQLENLHQKKIMPPAYLSPAPWTIDVLKIALLLRTADAAHIDSQRAPRFLQALVNPTGVSLAHWNFQTKLNSPKRDPDIIRAELCYSGSSFPIDEQDAWWLAYDTAKMVDKELRMADRLLVEFHRPRFAVKSVANSHSPENFARNVATEGWHPVDTSIKITNINDMVERFGGEKLYGQHPSSALRELIQNSVDSIRACRSLGGLGEDEGELEIGLEDSPQGQWLHVTDTGVGMSRYVLTEVLLDFGKSLWRSGDLQSEWKDLVSKKFEAVGKFGIGFFSIFMLGEHIKITTRRFEPKESESAQWLLEFSNGTHQRPTLRPPLEHEKMKRHGTRVSVLLFDSKLKELCAKKSPSRRGEITFPEVCAQLAPALDINFFVRTPGESRHKIVAANDWTTIDSLDLLRRIAPGDFGSADLSKGGPWKSMTDIESSSGKVIGRATVSYPSYAASLTGIGVYNGIFAGFIPGIVGIVSVCPQDDLARQSAIPCLSTLELQRWANLQSYLLSSLNKGSISIKDSVMLALYGAEHDPLTLGALAGNPCTYDELHQYCLNSDILILYDGTITHDDDDEILFRDFYSFFERDDKVLEIDISSGIPWVSKLEQNGPDRATCSVLSAVRGLLRQVWGGFDVDEDTQALVGGALGTNIYRDCNIYTRPK